MSFGGVENVSHVVKHDETESLADKRQAHGRSAQFQVVDEHGVPADRKPRKLIARPRLIDGKSSQGSAAASEKVLRQGNYAGSTERRFEPDAGGAGKDIFIPQTMIG